MFRYYTTPETRQALIAESNRLIAGRRAAMNAARGRREAMSDGDALESAAPAGEGRAEIAECGSESAFARLVADLQRPSGAGAARSTVSVR
jgi:hypothetical protein